ncbi:MAG TPA: F0F1 ATP synthase subunit alpha [Candidatus Sulfotelmatobacter sp.]|jgi:F-type H+-transporting ATPase subunit alpha|nr:F0F1 ATP synthase subunit alpha [Candidatus Sulfotelmatobacter sp.]
MINNNSIIENLEKKLSTFTSNPKTQNVGTVEKNTDGVIAASGLSKAFMGEIVEFEEGSKGVILNLDEDQASIILFNNGATVVEGMIVKTTGKSLTIRTSEELLGRVVNPIGISLDGKGEIKKGKEMPLEKIAAGVVDREPVNTPLKTGITAIDAMFPIGRGQRELIIGDRGLGKTAIAIDAIINQREQGKGLKPVISIYVAIGQKQNTVARVVDKLKQEKAMDNTIVVVAGASDPATLQYLAPYAGVAIAEYFLEKGQDVLIVYDDLTKHAWAYRQLSLVLRRPAGREAYPGDIFYLHSRLLERAVRLNEKNGGGSITALPIIETQANDISAYIPTNVISITDGQIFLQSDLFNAGIRPAINTGSSVSRVGGAAQTGAMKSVSGKMKLEMSQFRELEAFAQFGSDLDTETMAQLEQGRRINEVLKQPQYHPLSEAWEVINIAMVTNGFLNSIPVAEVTRFEKEFEPFVKKHHTKLLDIFGNGEKVTPESIKQLEKAVSEFRKTFIVQK